MKSDKGIVVFIIAGWMTSCGVVALWRCGVIATAIISASFTTPSLLIQTTLFFSPLLLRPLSSLMRLFRKPLFIVVKKQQRYWLHLNPWLNTGHLGLRRLSYFWQALTAPLRLTMEKSSLTVMMSSHLLGPSRMARLRCHFPAGYYLFHVIKRPIGPVERIGLQVDTFLNGWRWLTPSASGAVVIIRNGN